MEKPDKTRLKEIPEHLKQLELCTNRPVYRQGKKLTAVKVYTINNESQHLLIFGVPTVQLRTELKSMCGKFGQIVKIHVVKDYECEMFTECYHVHYERIQSARIAKRKLDNRSFYGGLLHVCYAPELESLEETRAKLNQRRIDVSRRLDPNFWAHRKFGNSGQTNEGSECSKKDHDNTETLSSSTPCLNGEKKPKASKKRSFDFEDTFPPPYKLSKADYVEIKPPRNYEEHSGSSYQPVPSNTVKSTRTTLIPTKVIYNYKNIEKNIKLSVKFKNKSLI